MRIQEGRVSYLETLGLSARDEGRVLADKGVVTLRERHHEVVHMGCLSGAHVVVVGELPKVTEVVDVRPLVLMSADGDASRSGLVQSLQ